MGKMEEIPPSWSWGPRHLYKEEVMECGRKTGTRGERANHGNCESLVRSAARRSLSYQPRSSQVGWREPGNQWIWVRASGGQLYVQEIPTKHLSLYQALLLLLSLFSCVQLCAIPQMAAHQAPPSLGFSRQEHWSGLPCPSPMHESES